MAGLWWRDCVLLAGAALLGVASFRAGMNAGEPWSGLRAALRCGTGGAAMVAVGLLLLAWVVAVQWEVWPTSAGHVQMVLAVVGAKVVTEYALLATARGTWGALAWAAGVGSAAIMAAELAGEGVSSAPCWFAGVAALLLIAEGWHLLHDVMPAFLRSEQRW